MNVEDAYALYRAHECDCLIAVGGGSPIDCAKAVGARVANPKKSLGKMKRFLKIWRPQPTLIAIPTTAGPGSEIEFRSVIVDAKKCHKYPISSFSLIPHYVILDPSLAYCCRKI